MGTVRRLAPAAGDVTLGQAVDAYLVTLGGAEQASTHRTYGRILRRVVDEFGAETAPDKVDAERFAEWFGSQWAGRAPSTWNVSLDAVRSAAAYWQRQGWLAADFSRMLVRRKPRPDRSRALSRAEVDQLLTRKDISLRERTLWRMLYETAARSAEVLALDVEDLDLPNRAPGSAARAAPSTSSCGRPEPPGSCPACSRAARPARCSSPTARPGCSCPPPTSTPPAGPGCPTSRPRPCSPRPPAARRCTSSATRALTHDAEDGTGTPMLMARSGHTSARSLARYARVSAEALARHQAERDPARRR